MSDHQKGLWGLFPWVSLLWNISFKSGTVKGQGGGGGEMVDCLRAEKEEQISYEGLKAAGNCQVRCTVQEGTNQLRWSACSLHVFPSDSGKHSSSETRGTSDISLASWLETGSTAHSEQQGSHLWFLPISQPFAHMDSCISIYILCSNYMSFFTKKRSVEIRSITYNHTQKNEFTYSKQRSEA